MDRDEAIRLLKGGRDEVREWNQRRERGEDIPDLSGADLRRADLRRADLSVVHLSGADLRRADLRGTDFSGADLSGADLSGAHLFRAHLSWAVLTRAILRGADLFGADLRQARLSGADLSSATCGSTNFGGVDLSEVKGQEKIEHRSPSTVGLDTLVRSRGRIPKKFLLGCGVPEKWIDYLPSLISALEPIQFSSCFISYSTKDQGFAERLHSRMRDKGLRVWFAPEDMQGGKEIHKQVDEAIRIHDKLLLVLSPHSLGSEWVMTEIRKAFKAEAREGRRKLFPIRLVDFEAIRDWECIDTDSGKDLGVEIRKFFIPDFTNWKDHDAFEAAFARLIKDLEAPASTGEGTEGTGREGPPKATASTSGRTKGRVRKGRPKRP
jgi:uncharacterized protein YjbI with pentapeptide repeats